MTIPRILRIAAILAAVALAHVAAPASAFELTGPVAYRNLAVYFVRGNGSAAAAPLTLEQALHQGAVKVYEGAHGQVAVENVSAHSVFVQVGDLLVGGLQDQVAGTDLVIGPHSGRVPIATFCVDPFRSTARSGESAKLFAATRGLIPSRMALLALLAGDSTSDTARRVRQAALWWSIDSLRLALSHRLEHRLDTPRAVHWDREALDDQQAIRLQQGQRSPWTTSLPLALEDHRLARAQSPYVDTLLAAGDRDGIIGAVFAIDGRVVSGDLYGSAALFRRMWPALLRAHATQALAAAQTQSAAPPAAKDVDALLQAASASPRAWRLPAGDMNVHEDESMLVAESSGPNGAWIHRAYVTRLAPADAANSPDAALVDALQTGAVEGLWLDSLGSDDPVMLQSNAAHDHWAVQAVERWHLAARASAARPADAPGSARPMTLAALFGLAVLILLWNLLPALKRSGDPGRAGSAAAPARLDTLDLARGRLSMPEPELREGFQATIASHETRHVALAVVAGGAPSPRRRSGHASPPSDTPLALAA